MPPKPKLYTAVLFGEELTQGINQWAEYIGFTSVALRKHVKLAGDNMQKALYTIGSKRPTLGKQYYKQCNNYQFIDIEL